MTGVKISTLPAADAANDTDQLEVNQGGTSRRVTVGQVAALVQDAIETADGIVSVGDYGAIGDGVTDDTTAFEAMLASGAALCQVPQGTYRITRKLIVPDGTELCGQGRGYQFDARTKLIFSGTGTREHVIAGATATSVANPDIGAPYLADSGTRGDAYKTLDLTVAFSAAIILGKASCLRNFGIYPNFDGVAGYAGTDGRLSDDWDVGVWARNSDDFVLSSCDAHGHWRKAGLLVSSSDIGDSQIPSNQFGHVEHCRFGGFMGVSIRAAETTLPTNYAFAGLDFVNCYVSGLAHQSSHLATSSFLAVPFPSPSGCLEISGDPMRGIQFLNCSFLHRDDIAAFLGKASEIMFDGCYWESKTVQVGGAGAWLANSLGSRMVATLDQAGLKFLGNSAFGIDMSSSVVSRGQGRDGSLTGQRYVAAGGVFTPTTHYDDDYSFRVFQSYIGQRLRYSSDNWRIDNAAGNTTLFAVNDLGHVAGKLLYTGTLTLTDDTAGSITCPKNGGFCLITNAGSTENGNFPDSTRSGMVFYDVGTAAFTCTKQFGGATFLAVNTDVTGTTGVDGNVTVGVILGTLRIENRASATQVFRYTFLS